MDNNNNTLWEGKLPEWTKEYPYTGVVNFEDNMEFDAGTLQMDIVPQIQLENSLPYEPIRLIFDIDFADGDFEIAGYDYENYGIAETEEVMDYPSEEEIAALGIQEDMLAYRLVLNNKKPFVSMNEDGEVYSYQFVFAA